MALRRFVSGRIGAGFHKPRPQDVAELERIESKFQMTLDFSKDQVAAASRLFPPNGGSFVDSIAHAKQIKPPTTPEVGAKTNLKCELTLTHSLLSLSHSLSHSLFFLVGRLSRTKQCGQEHPSQHTTELHDRPCANVEKACTPDTCVCWPLTLWLF